uniref:Thiamine-phosphate synthase n=1 Tax=Cyanothece sp. (strain PCC 7425 / ATCC 29141) TaxID=395961 RepID=B8HY75_CYAP4
MISPNPALYRILDANLDRAREGLRVVEEWCRFGLENATLTECCKNLRQQLARWHHPELRSARNTPTDPGTSLTHPQEEQRTDLTALLQANFGRVQEALRVLEEYGKLYNPALAEESKQMRYQVYSLESQLLPPARQQKLRQSPLYLVTSPSDHLFTVVEQALQGGLTLVQYRDKTTDDGIRFERAAKLCHLCHQYNALFLVNDRVDLALAVNADGVHLGQQDLPLAVARQLLGPDRIIGQSTTNPTEMAQAIAAGADYIGVGPVYATPTKAGKAPAGLEYVRYAASHAPLPWYAIGGIDLTNVADVLAAGARGVAVVRALMEAESPEQVTRSFLSQFNRSSTAVPE